MVSGRKLDKGNPNPGHLGSDFGRFGLQLWPRMALHDPKTSSRRDKLQTLCDWRNAIAHQDFSGKGELDLGNGRTTLRLSDVRRWRNACERLAWTLDEVLGDHLSRLVGQRLW